MYKFEICNFKDGAVIVKLLIVLALPPYEKKLIIIAKLTCSGSASSLLLFVQIEKKMKKT